ncbi:MAG TPA: WG repeat-containing protein [Pyrinomonadaceae bacterium]
MKALTGFATLLSWLLIPCLVLICHAQDKGIFLIQQDEKFGYIDRNGRTIIRPAFDAAGKFHEGLAKVRTASKWGYIDKTGQVVISPQFESADDFAEGLAAARTEGKFGYIDSQGRFIIKAEYEEAWPFSEGFALVKKAGSYGYINKSGEVVIPFRFEGAGDFVEGLGLVQLNGKYGYVDKTGKMVIEPQFDWAGGFSEGLARVVVNNKVGFIDRTGAVKIFPQFDSAAPFSEGFAVIQADSGKLGYINKRGETVIQPRFSMAGQFKEGLAPVSVGSHGGFIDANGKLVIESPWFDMGEEFFDGLALMKTSDALAYLDKQGRYVWKETIRPLPEVLKEITSKPLTKKQKAHGNLYKEFESDESLIDRIAKSRRGQFLTYSKAVLLPDSDALPDVTTFLNDISCDADVVVEGTIVNDAPLFTPNGKFIFTEYKLKVENILKNNQKGSILKSQVITVVRAGGRINIAGRSISASVGTSVYPATGERYLLFLRYLPATRSYRAWLNGTFQVMEDRVSKLSSNSLWKSEGTSNLNDFRRIVGNMVLAKCQNSQVTRLVDQ